MTTRNTTFQLKSSNTPNQAYPSNLLRGEPIVNTADGIMLFSGVTTSTSGWTQSPSGTTFFEVGSNLYNLKIRNQITSYSGITNLSGKFLSGTSNGFVLANISDITTTGGTVSGDYLPLSGGTVTGSTTFTNGLTANTISATTYYNVSPNFQYEIHVSQVDGNDSTGDGSLLNPVASITKALTLITGQRRTIIIHPGSYTESPSITTQYTVLTTYEPLGGNTAIVGTVSTSVGCTIAGLAIQNLTITTGTGVGVPNIINCNISGTLTKSGNATFTDIHNCNIDTACNITGTGLVTINDGNPNFVTVNNAGANVIIKNAMSCVAPSVTAGTLNITDSIVVAYATNAVTSSAGSVITLGNSQFLTSALNNVAPVSLSGFYSIFNCVFDKPNSTLVTLSGTGGSTNSIDYFQYINADKFITQGGTSSQYVMGNGSLSNGFTGGTVSGSTIFTNGLTANTISATTYQNLPDNVTGNYLPLSGGTVTGGTIFQSGVTANTISATTYYNLPTDVFVTGGTYTSGNVIFTNNTGGTFTVTGFAIGGGGGEIFYLNLSQSQNGNRLLSTTASTASEQTSGVTIGNGVTGSIASFQTTPLNISLIPGGIWSFYLHSYKQNSNASFNIFVEVYKITSGGGQTLLFATDPTSVTTDSPNPSMQLTDGYFSGTPLSISDSIVAVVRATNTGNQSHTITLITEGSQHYSYAVSTIPTQQGLTCDTLSGCSIIQTIQTDISNKFDKSGGTVSGATIFTGGLSANTISTTTISATTINSGSTNLSNLFLNENSLIAGTNIKLSATSNSVTINSSYPHTGFLTVNNGAKRYYHNTINFVSSMGVAAPGTNTLRLYPFINNRTITLNEIAVNCTTSGASGVVALALYDSLPNSELRPNNLLQVFGSASTTTTGVKSITGSTITLQPGLYWFGINNNSTAQFSSPASGCISLGSNISMSTQVASMSSAVTFSMSFPASMSAATTYAQATLLFAYHPLTVS